MILRPEGRHPGAAKPKSCGEFSLDPSAYSDVVPYLFSELPSNNPFAERALLSRAEAIWSII
jgi:hypothetical protein